jgi:CelD/BcsL family acetyltransferase involved in cellulose biosynthesis
MISPLIKESQRSDRENPSISVFESAANPGFRSASIETVEGFRAFETSWRLLVERAENASPSLAWEWISAWWDIFGEKCPKTGRAGVPYVIVVYDGEEMVGAFPLVSHTLPRFGFGLRRLRPMGYAGELEPSGLTEESLSVVLPGYEVPARRQAIEHIARDLAKGRWDCAVLRQLQPDQSAEREFGVAGVYVSTKSKVGPQIVHLPPTWSEFRKQLTKSMRDNLPYYPRLLKRAGHEFQVRICDAGQPLTDAGEELIRLHRLRVFSDVGQTHQDYFTSRWQPEMLHAALRRLGAAGRGFIAVLEVQGHAVAAQAFIESESELVVHYSGFDPEYAKFSPLLVLQSEVFRQAIEKKELKRLNLLFGSAQWQKRWGANPETYEIRTLMLRLRPLALIRAAFYAIGRESVAYTRRTGLRRWFKKFAR